MNSSYSPAKVGFVLSIAVLSFVYGTAVGKWEVFPYSFIDRAADQAQAVIQAATLPSLSQSGSTQKLGNLQPQTYDRKGVRTPNPERVQPGFTLITSPWKNADGWNIGFQLVDKEGQVLHRWKLDREEAFQLENPTGDIQGSSLLPNGEMVLNLEYDGMARLDACGDTLWTLGERTHHSIAQAEDGSFWVPAISDEGRSGSERYPDGYPGLDGKKVWIERILHVSEKGKVLDTINVLDVLYANNLERYIPKMLGGVRPTPDKIPADLTHVNDVEPLSSSLADEYPLFEAGDLLVSLRVLSLVFVLDPESGNVKWHATDPFIYQHDPDFLGNGWIGVFDNNYDLTRRGTMLGGSRIVALQPHTDSMEVRFPTQHSDPFYTHIRGKWQQLENGNMLLTESAAGRIVEVGPDGRTVWEWVHESSNSKVPEISQGTRVDLTVEDIASWPCSSVDSIRASNQKQ